MGQQSDDIFEFRSESFSLRSVIPTGAGQCTFEAVGGGPYHRSVTGTIRVGLSRRVYDFRMDEHGQAIQGVMNTYTLVKSAAATAMLKKYGEIFFEGDYTALELPE